MDSRQSSTYDFSGTIHGIQLVDLVQLACPARKSMTLRVESGNRQGAIHVREGQVTHVETGVLQGEEALFDMLIWDSGHFEGVPLEAKEVTSVSKPWEYLLIDAMRFCDEKGLGCGETQTSVEVDSKLFSGSVSGIQLLDILQLVCIIRSGHFIEVQSQNRRGKIWLEAGQVQHAETEALEGEEALLDMLLWKNGCFNAAYSEVAVAKSIKKPWELLIIAGLRLRDQEAETPDEEGGEKGLGKEESLTQRILRMKTAAKIRLAMMGDKEARSVLIHDGSRLVQQAIISNPKITESEVVAIASSKSVNEEVIRKVANSREWMKSYQIRLALVRNPKTPLPISVKLVQTLLPQDLKQIAKSKGIPSAVAHSARKLVLEGG